MATSATKKRLPARKAAATTTKKAAATKVSAKAQKAASITVKEAALHPTSSVAEVPHQSILDGYISRRVSFGAIDVMEFDAFDAAIKNMWNVLIEGPTGPGKTTSVQAWCAKRGVRFGSVSSNAGAEPTQFMGKFNPDETGQAAFVWVDGVVADIFRYGGALLVNEANFLPERIATVLFGPLDGRRALTLMDHNGEVIKAHRPPIKKYKGGKMIEQSCWCSLSKAECKKRWVLIIADMNPDYEGTRPLNKAFRNRFAMQLVFDYDPEVERQLIESESLRNMASDLRSSQEYETPVATNMLFEFESMVRELGIDFASQNFINRFAVDEREPVKIVVDAYKANIELDLLGDSDADTTDEADVDDIDTDPIIVDNATFNWVRSN